MSPDYKFPSKEMTEFQLVTEVWATANKTISFWRSTAIIGWTLALAELILRLV